MNVPPRWTSLVAFAEQTADPVTSLPIWALGVAAPPLPPVGSALRRQLDSGLDAAVSLERAAWVQEGVHLRPSTLPAVHHALLHACRALATPVPAALATQLPFARTGAYGTDQRPLLVMPTQLVAGLAPAELHFLLGSLVGRIALRHVTALTLQALLTDHGGLRGQARKALGPWIDAAIAPLGLVLRVALSRWTRTSTLASDRAGLVASQDLEAACQALMRITWGTTPPVDAATWLREQRHHQHDREPGRWAEALAGQPWLDKRLRALELFSRSAAYARATDQPVPDGALDDEALHRGLAAFTELGA